MADVHCLLANQHSAQLRNMFSPRRLFQTLSVQLMDRATHSPQTFLLHHQHHHSNVAFVHHYHHHSSVLLPLSLPKSSSQLSSSSFPRCPISISLLGLQILHCGVFHRISVQCRDSEKREGGWRPLMGSLKEPPRKGSEWAQAKLKE